LFARYLRENNIAGEIVILEHQASTVEEAARALDVPAERIVKTVVFCADTIPILVIANGATRIDIGRLADYLGMAKKKIKLADAATVLECTGFSIGGVPPFGHKVRLRTLVEDRVLTQPEVYAGGGAVDAVLRIAPPELVRTTAAEIINLSS
jgi:Cys-tRNA(Pro) deacylase